MKKRIPLILLTAVGGIAPIAEAGVSTRVCLADGNTPFELVYVNPTLIEYPEIMVGTKLTIIVDSNVGGNWGSDLTIEGQYMDYGLLSARDFNDITGDWEGSRLEAAGYGARVWDWVEPGIQGFMLDGHTSAIPGDWFIIDYLAMKVGTCEVGFYDRSTSWDEPVCHLAFSHVATRDFDDDTKVDFADFAALALYWQEANCGDPSWCNGIDLDTDGKLGLKDLMLFTDYWLERAE